MSIVPTFITIGIFWMMFIGRMGLFDFPLLCLDDVWWIVFGVHPFVFLVGLWLSGCLDGIFIEIWTF